MRTLATGVGERFADLGFVETPLSEVGRRDREAHASLPTESDEVDAHLRRPTAEARRILSALAEDDESLRCRRRRRLFEGGDSSLEVVEPGAVIRARDPEDDDRGENYDRSREHRRSLAHCPTCLSEAVIRYLISDDTEGRTFLICSTCGNESSSVECGIDDCELGGRAVCQGSCKRALCRRHGGLTGECTRCRQRAKRAAVARQKARRPETVAARGGMWWVDRD